MVRSQIQIIIQHTTTSTASINQDSSFSSILHLLYTSQTATTLKMQFSAQVTGAVALFLFSLPALATTTAATHTSSVAPAPHASGSATASAPTASGTGKSGVMMPQDPQVVLSNLKDYHQAASDELTQCAKARSLPLCLARGITIPAGKTYGFLSFSLWQGPALTFW